jgi:hypothetical protein
MVLRLGVRLAQGKGLIWLVLRDEVFLEEELLIVAYVTLPFQL